VNKAPFDELIKTLDVSEPSLRTAALTLVNLIIYRAPSEKKKAQFLARLENMGLYDSLNKLG